MGYSPCGHKESDMTEVTKQQPILYHNKKYKKQDLSVFTWPQSWEGHRLTHSFVAVISGWRTVGDGPLSAFLFPAFFLAWDIYCFLNVKNFKYRKHGEKGNKHLCMYYFRHLKNLLIINTMRRGKNQCPPPNRKTGKTRTTPLLSKTPSHTPTGKRPVEGPGPVLEPASGWAVATWVTTERVAWIPSH